MIEALSFDNLVFTMSSERSELSELVAPAFPRVPTWCRAIALGIDAFLVLLITGLLGLSGLVGFLVFMLLWIASRVFVVYRNYGQSLGRWALNMRVIDTRFHRTPQLLELSKREGVLGFFVFLALNGLGSLASGHAGVVLLLVPLIADGGTVLFDMAQYPQTLHDRLGETIVIGVQRGYSLDIRVKNWIDKMQQYLK
ncbi:RDD domain-containing protein [Arthrospira platensis C1]|nr:RDD domain-containing protein [Arthrospira platensis C1]